jgi:hypothetical protein
MTTTVRYVYEKDPPAEFWAAIALLARLVAEELSEQSVAVVIPSNEPILAEAQIL